MHPDHIRLAGLQLAITIIGTAVTCAAVSFLAAKSVAFGGCVAFIGTAYLALRYMKSEDGDYSSAERILRHAYRTAIERFMLVVFLLALGFKILKLAPFWLLVGFVAGQLAWFAAPVWMRLKKQNDK